VGKWNPLIPYARECRNVVADEDANGVVSVERIRTKMWGNPGAVLQAVDLLISCDRLVASAIRTVLRDWPAHKVVGATYEHVEDSDGLTVEQLSGIVSLRRRQLGDDENALRQWEDRLAAARLSDALERGLEAPVEDVREL
jgi:hypothetical protein